MQKLTLSLILAICYCVLEPVGFSKNGELFNHFVYMFFHGNIIHLLSNLYALRVMPMRNLPVAFGIAILCSFVCYTDYPTVGFSGVIFALYGMNCDQYRIAAKTWMIVLFTLLIGFVFSRFNNTLHIACFTVGFFTNVILRLRNEYKGLA